MSSPGRFMLLVAALGSGGAATAISTAAGAQYCPCYTASSSFNTHDCGVEAVPGQNPTDAEWQVIFDVVSRGPEVWGSDGPSVSEIGAGCGVPEEYHLVPARFPCELLKAIAMAESGWKQFCVPDRPDDQIGPPERTIISFDCGYGVGQVTSGMHTGETPSFDRQRVAAEALYNLATGAQIYASKWRATECVGDNQPTVIEHWYLATWAYNGLAYSNNPNNPSYDANRGIYDPANPDSRPYQEKVFGRVEHTGGRWTPTALAYPNPGDIGNSTAHPQQPPQLPEPDCASPTDCTGERPTHQTICMGEGGSGAGGAAAGGASAAAGGTG
ncbi:MAG: hypothetical protein JRI23_27770, partial [Deltaproteobacteria bacterium]|nr:hypothetical protein [Deltaproteobacteria bacterium]MBW2535887.1 hypothetical protein [Deltaproteobacteria bacterium]